VKKKFVIVEGKNPEGCCTVEYFCSAKPSKNYIVTVGTLPPLG
jgi:hypothetical protein